MELLEDNATCLKGTQIAEPHSSIREGASISLHLIETQKNSDRTAEQSLLRFEMSHERHC